MVLAYMEEQIRQSGGLVPLALAAKQTGLSEELLRKFIRDGVLEGNAPYRTSSVLGECNLKQAEEIAVKLKEARVPVEGRGILATDAAKKYGFSNPTIYTWYKNGHISLVATKSNGDWLFNEGDIAFAKAIAIVTGKSSYIYPSRNAGRPKAKQSSRARKS